MPKVATFFRGLIRRVKKHMAAVVVGVGIFCATSGLYVILEHSQYKIWGLIFGILGVILVLIGYILSYVQDKEERQERIEEQARREAEWLVERTESRNLLAAILLELKRLNQSKDTPRND